MTLRSVNHCHIIEAANLCWQTNASPLMFCQETSIKRMTSVTASVIPYFWPRHFESTKHVLRLYCAKWMDKFRNVNLGLSSSLCYLSYECCLFDITKVKQKQNKANLISPHTVWLLDSDDCLQVKEMLHNTSKQGESDTQNGWHIEMQ